MMMRRAMLWKQATSNVRMFTSTKRDTEELPYLELTRDFLDPKDFYQCLSKNGVHFYTGVPDSLLKDFCGYVTGKQLTMKKLLLFSTITNQIIYFIIIII